MNTDVRVVLLVGGRLPDGTRCEPKVAVSSGNLLTTAISDTAKTSEDAALQLLAGLGVEPKYLGKLGFYESSVEQMSVAYLAVVPELDPLISLLVELVEWGSVCGDVEEKMMADVREHLLLRIHNTAIAFAFVPEKFTLGEIISVYETILGKSLDKRNFRRKVLEGSKQRIKAVGYAYSSRGVAGRPPNFYVLNKGGASSSVST
jgi:8-oxo-dGTP diphosphatase